MRVSDARDNIGTTPVRAGFGFDIDALTRWMSCHVDGFSGPIEVAQFRGGQSNPTFKLTTSEREYVLRRKPPGRLLKGAHAVDREARVMRALGRAGFPVPEILGLCEDETVIGSLFVVMAYVPGRIFWDPRLPELVVSERAAYFDAMNAVLARLHGLDPAACDLADYGNPGQYVARQIARWSQQYLQDVEAGRDPHLDRLVEWLPSAVPADDEAVAVIHGDFRCDNMIFDPEEPRIVAVLDWELSTLGHPLADFAYHALMYRLPPEIGAGLGGIDPRTLGLPSERDYVAAYCARTGRSSIAHYEFYLAFNLFRLAAIFHGIKGRVARGSAASAQAAQRVAILPELARLAWSQARAAGAPDT